MCVIITLPPKKNVPYRLLENAVYNNPHGYGLIIQRPKGNLEVVHALHENGTDPKEVDDILRDNEKYNRYLHLRWKTEGAISKENCHPFSVFKSDKDEVWFMHNGTLYEHRPLNSTDTRSDSLIFAEKILRPVLGALEGRFNNEGAQLIINKFWGVGDGNKGLLVSRTQAPLFINFNNWKVIKSKDEDDKDLEFYASNDTYFDKVTRGFEFERREAARKAAEAAKEAEAAASRPLASTASGGSSTWPLTAIKNVDLSMNKCMGLELKDLMSDYDLWTDEGLAKLVNISLEEFTKHCKDDPNQAAATLVYLTSEFAKVCRERDAAHAKHLAASKMIADLKSKKEKFITQGMPAQPTEFQEVRCG